MTIKLADSCNQKPITTTAWRHSQWHRRQLQWQWRSIYHCDRGKWRV
jgi:hypothetical protein